VSGLKGKSPKSSSKSGSKKASKSQDQLELLWQQSLSDYVTAIAWRPSTSDLVAAAANGEIIYCTGPTCSSLQPATDQSVDCLAISTDGQFLAAGGQSGQVKIWRLSDLKPVTILENAPAWVDRIAWSPTQNQLAFSLGKYVQVWDAEAGIVTTLNFENSSVLDITWHPDGNQLTVAGYQSIKVWSALDWDDDPTSVEIGSASTLIRWSPDGKYIASSNIDKTIAVIEWGNSGLPWIMRGFPGKIRQLTWTDTPIKQGAPLLASSSADSIVVWERHPDDSIGWEGRVLGQHDARIEAMQFQPQTALLTSAGADGWVVLWPQASRLGQMLKGAPDGFSCLAWHPQGQQLAAGGAAGELLVWAKSMRGTGFG
jgi:WD40 repeat protein